jgi:hypothetical protein
VKREDSWMPHAPVAVKKGIKNLKIYFNVILSFMPKPGIWSLPLRFFKRTLLYFPSGFPHDCPLLSRLMSPPYSFVGKVHMAMFFIIKIAA